MTPENCVDSYQVRAWEASSGKPILWGHRPLSPIASGSRLDLAAVLSPDGQRLALSHKGGEVRIMDLELGQVMFETRHPDAGERVPSVSFGRGTAGGSPRRGPTPHTVKL